MSAPHESYITEEEKRNKDTFAATEYSWMYVTKDQKFADRALEEDPTRDILVIDRSKMWDAPKVKGCKSNYEFKKVTLQDPKTGKAAPGIQMNYLPCVCENCASFGVSQNCTLKALVGNPTCFVMNENY